MVVVIQLVATFYPAAAGFSVIDNTHASPRDLSLQNKNGP
jgi:hypothetical protein